MRSIVLPQFGMGMSSGTIVAWHVSSGDKVGEGQLLFEVEAEKASIEVPSPCAGIVHEIFAGAGAKVAVRELVATIDDGSGAQADQLAVAMPAKLAAASVRSPDCAFRQNDARQIEPRARRLATDRLVDLDRVRGTGPAGRVIAEDVILYLDGRNSRQSAEVIEAEARYDARRLYALMGELEECLTGTKIELADMLARVVSLAAERSGVWVAPIRIEVDGRVHVDCHRRPISKIPEAPVSGALPFAKMLIFRSDTIRKFVPRGEGEAVTLCAVADSVGGLLIALRADADLVEAKQIIAFLEETAGLIELPIAILA